MAKPPKTKSVERKIYFYRVICICNGKKASLSDVFNAYIEKLAQNRTDLVNRRLAIPYFDKYHFLDVQQHATDKTVYLGQFYSLRSTDFPYLFNVLNGNRQEIESNENDTLMEQTHFFCFTDDDLIVSEFNFHGARIEQIGTYLRTIMYDIYPGRQYSIEVMPIIIPDYYKKIVNCKTISKIQFKVAGPGIKLLKEQGVINAYDIAAGNFESGMPYYIDIEISGGKKGTKIPVKNSKAFLKKIINVIKDALAIDETAINNENPIFRKAKIRGFDVEEGKTIPYDLLDEKLVQISWVDKISYKSKYVDSKKMFSALAKAYRDKRDLAIQYMETDKHV